ncbi:MAG: AEC family transporter [Clostridia bacterium]|nr:AEC family transporter [Clostridia bacterium]
MEVSVLNVFLSVFALTLLAVPGFIVGKCKILKEGATKILTDVLLYIGQPLLTFMSFQKAEYSTAVVKNLLVVAGVAILVHIIMLLIMFGLFFKKGTNDEKFRILSFASVFGNCGFMGLPFLQMLFGQNSPEALMYGAVVISVFNAFSWTVGIFFISRDKKFVSVKKAFFNPPFIALVISLPLFLILKKPINLIGVEGTFIRQLFEKVYLSGNYLGELVTPLSMIILGLRLSEMKFKTVFLKYTSYISSAFKLILMPTIAFILCTIFNLPELLKWAIVFEFSMPTAVQTLLFTEKYGNDPHSAGSAVLLATILSILTIPFTFLIFNLF